MNEKLPDDARTVRIERAGPRVAAVYKTGSTIPRRAPSSPGDFEARSPVIAVLESPAGGRALPASATRGASVPFLKPHSTSTSTRFQT